ncbi:MAG: hypothetical protein IJW33_06305 [Lentisphaeria bacterium]|nr:hypothetical protein [Lentisphaeria bacterium]
MKKYFTLLGLIGGLFTLSAGLQFSPGASMSDGVISFASASGYVQQRGSETFSAGKGLTISAAVFLQRRKPIEGSGFDENKEIVFQHDFIAGKDGVFAFGRRSDSWVDQMYINFFDGKKWCVRLSKAAATPAYRQWAVWAVTLEPQFRREEGRKYTTVTLFINGEPQWKKEIDGHPAEGTAPVRWGEGVDIKGKKWGFNGKLAEVQIFDRVLSDDEIMLLARNSELVKVDAPGFAEITPELEKLFASYFRKGGPVTLWIRRRLEYAARNGFDQKAIIEAVKKVDPALKSENYEDFLRLFNQAGTFLKLVENDELLALVATGKGSGAFPLLGVLDKDHSRMNYKSVSRTSLEIFGKQSIAWVLSGVKGKEKWRANSYGAWSCRETGKNSFEAVWQLDKLKVTSNFAINDRRITFDFAADNQDRSLRLENLNFPVVRLREKVEGAPGKLVYPCQSGVLFDDPVSGTLPPACWYPSGRLNMQFSAYYDFYSGVYVSPEDPEGKIKELTIRSRGGDLEICWSNPVAFARDRSGGNSIARMPSAAVEVFYGDWFDAAMVYKKFAGEKARWNRPRFRPTPKWFEENLLWFCHWTFKPADLKAMPGIMRKMRDYFEVPFGVHWYRWNDGGKGGFPHSFAKDGIDKINAELLKMGVFTKSYIDNRLWSELDGPHRKVDLEFQKYGKKYAVLNADKTMNYERYSPACRDVVMCAGVPAWQEKMTSVTDRVAGYGFAAIYHDQVSASRPFACFDPDHGHDLNDPAAWGDGYWKMFEKIAKLQAKYPELAHDTEDASEAHLPFFDGFLTWRWTDQNQIPLFAAVYAGKTQFTGRHFENTSTGDEKSFMVKCALQLLQGEQIGWFTYGMLIKSQQRIVFAKQMVHLRKLLLSYFNGGMMLKPFYFDPASPMQTTSWGIAAPKPHDVTLPEILHSRFKRASDGAETVVFINTSDRESSAGVLCDGSYLACRSDGSVTKAGLLSKPGNGEIIKLAPFGFEVWTTAPESEAKAIAAELKRIAGFKAGNLMAAFGILALHDTPTAGLNFDNVSGRGVSGKGEMLSIQGNGKSTLQYKVKMLLEKNKRYELTMQMRKSAGGKGYFGVANYSSSRKLKFYGAAGNNIPADEKWHEVKLTFTTDDDLYNCGLFIYNTKSSGVIAVEKIALKEIN